MKTHFTLAKVEKSIALWNDYHSVSVVNNHSIKIGDKKRNG